MIIKDGVCETCEHFVKDAYGQWGCEFDGECENMVREKTNEEWLHSLNTEQLADKLTDFSFWLVVTIPTEDKREKVRKRIVEWLKQHHRKV